MFITIEGGEGSGKSTAAKSLALYYNDLGYDVVLTREPGGTELADSIRSIVMNQEMSAYSEAMLFNIARLDHLEKVILPALKDKKIVICDRFIDSSRVYQGILGDLTYKEYMEIENMNDTISNSKDLIDITLLFDVDPIIGLNRISDNQRETNRFDEQNIEYHKSIQTAYHQLRDSSEYGRIFTIDASQTEEKILEDCISKINEKLNEGD